MVPATQGTARPRALPVLFSSKEPKPGMGGKSLVDSLADTSQKELTAEEKIAALRNEIASQVSRAAEPQSLSCAAPLDLFSTYFPSPSSMHVALLAFFFVGTYIFVYVRSVAISFDSFRLVFFFFPSTYRRPCDRDLSGISSRGRGN